MVEFIILWMCWTCVSMDEFIDVLDLSMYGCIVCIVVYVYTCICTRVCSYNSLKTWMQDGDTRKNLGAASHLAIASTAGTDCVVWGGVVWGGVVWCSVGWCGVV